MTKQVSTALSDLFLSLSCLLACYDIFLKKENVFLIYGFILLGLASFAGVARFSGCDSVKDLHKALSVHAGAVGLPWVLLLFASIQLNQGAKLSLVSPGWDILVVLGMHVCTTQYENTRQMLIPATLIGLTYSAIINSNQSFLIATGCLLLSGLIGATGKIGPVYRVDLFHFALCGAVYFLRSGLLSIV
ncbi:hypothetical protein ACHWQZ_G003975 [Mnemiopsis leidyi]